MSKRDWCTGVPDYWKSYDFSGCCRAHDEAYAKHENRRKADLEFYWCLKRIHPYTAWLYFHGVRLCGWVPWIMTTVRLRLSRRR